MAAKRPKSITEARRLLNNADPKTETGRDQIDRIQEWSREQDTLPRDFSQDLLAAMGGRRAAALLDGPTEALKRAIDNFGQLGDDIVGLWGPPTQAPLDPSSEGVRFRGQGPRPSAVPGEEAPEGGPGSDPINDIIANIQGGGDDIVLGGLPNWPGPQASERYMRQGSEPFDTEAGPESPYFRGSGNALLQAMPAEERARIQEVLMATGLASNVIPGELDPNTISGFERLLGMANQRGERWTNTFTRLKTRADRGELGEGGSEQDAFRFVEGSFLPPDPAETRNAVRDLARQIVPGMDLSDGEVELLARQFEQFGEQQFGAMEQNRRFEAEAEYRAGRPVEPGTEEVIEQSSGVMPVNAAERFREFFEERYKPNIERQGRVETGRDVAQLVRGGIGTAAQMTGGR